MDQFRCPPVARGRYGSQQQYFQQFEGPRHRACGCGRPGADAAGSRRAAVCHQPVPRNPVAAHASVEPRALDGVDPRLARAFALVQAELGAPPLAVPGRPKHTLADFYFRRAAVDGMTDPYFLETLVASDLLPFERPFVVAHEWSHLAGYADESEANFVGWLTCVRAGGDDAYSGWLFLYGEMIANVSAADRRSLPELAPGPRADRRAIADRFRRNVSPRMS